MEVLVKKWGNSAAIRIPASVLADAKIKLDEPVEVREERGRIVIEPLHSKVFAIRELIKGIRPDNLHEAIETGASRGREVW
jgi:antitoxin MazE